MTRYYYIENGETQSPAAISWLVAEHKAGRMPADTLICLEGGDKWESLELHLPLDEDKPMPRARALKTVVRKDTPSARVATTNNNKNKPAFGGLSTLFFALLFLSVLGLIFAIYTAAQVSATMVILTLIFTLPTLVVYYALYVICSYLKKL